MKIVDNKIYFSVKSIEEITKIKYYRIYKIITRIEEDFLDTILINKTKYINEKDICIIEKINKYIEEEEKTNKYTATSEGIKRYCEENNLTYLVESNRKKLV